MSPFLAPQIMRMIARAADSAPRPQVELVRLPIPRRVYTNRQLTYAAESIFGLQQCTVGQ
ncbi:hypothetical protein DNFV4_01054 [Nitrospira tepida]|uniref:Uncharacterized protein n=1 Tax=Nitrospira tepida TaxID=2973512 RepID=A0AA86MX23_9BACT|nr:hypothetical protein DNFV4_01054 [Nitrospira tepida]